MITNLKDVNTRHRDARQIFTNKILKEGPNFQLFVRVLLERERISLQLVG